MWVTWVTWYKSKVALSPDGWNPETLKHNKNTYSCLPLPCWKSGNAISILSCLPSRNWLGKRGQAETANASSMLATDCGKAHTPPTRPPQHRLHATGQNLRLYHFSGGPPFCRISNTPHHSTSPLKAEWGRCDCLLGTEVLSVVHCEGLGARAHLDKWRDKAGQM